ncbi:MAG: mechanosensitive ion channel family protein [Spirochaetaceae bacterium]|nr:mechanosensitive ion channel family protein [Myxococcales bacterium]MCB9724145.1 mechanosensitive ion channel family protein [Spirochaetaceae bacterium]HPG26371.1 mechanosensitive ion channel family protein [Myxococcota bacterium]
MDEFLRDLGLRGGEVAAAEPWWAIFVDLALVALAATIVYFVVRWALIRAAHGFAATTSTHWDDELVRSGVFSRVAWIAPAFVVHYGMGFFPTLAEGLVDGVRRVSVAVMLLVGTLAISSFLRAAEAIYDSHPEYRERPIKGYLQVFAIVVHLVAALLILAVLMNRSPWIFVSGIGAMTAVLLLIFRDTILSFVASIQLAGNDMIRVGDWIEMPGLGADGDVIEVALHTVKVQNWDKTITTIPTHRLISDSFKNWRGMAASGGRRIKRSVAIDLQTVRFLTDEEIERFGRWSLLRDYVARKREELLDANRAPGVDPSVTADLRRLTNLGTFRAWILATLRRNPAIHQEGYTLLVRQLEASGQGVPIEVYCFTTDTAWVAYEDIQSDLFDRILAMVPEFGLRVFQQPSGNDLRTLARAGAPPDTGPSSSASEREGTGE